MFIFITVAAGFGILENISQKSDVLLGQRISVLPNILWQFGIGKRLTNFEPDSQTFWSSNQFVSCELFNHTEGEVIGN